MFQSIATQFNAGGTFMWIILAVFAIAVAVMAERLFYYYVYCRSDNMKRASRIISFIDKDDLSNASNLAQSRTTPMHRLFQTAIGQYSNGRTPEQVLEKIEQSAIRELPRLSQRINYLSLIANVSTLLGLLGTITGLQLSFSSMASVDPAQRASMLAMGISQAMNTTAFGLIVAVPCMIMYTFLSNKQQAIIKGIDEGVSHFISTIKDKKQ